MFDPCLFPTTHVNKALQMDPHVSCLVVPVTHILTLLNSTLRFLTDDEEFTEQPSSVRQCSRLLLVGVLGPIINTSVFSEFSSKKLLVIQFFISTMHSISFSIWCVSPGREEI